ncbi:MAG: GntR family transcriptional regulator [Acidobacteria bacterium]|nr:GntR family transcriptional regulator [Acidobacteriota bacterium]
MIDHVTTALPHTKEDFKFEEVAAHSLRTQIAGRIRLAILEGSLHEGERIVERKLAGQFNASLTAVREALIELETEGYVTKKPNASTHVKRLTPEDIEEVFDVRGMLEAGAVEQAAIMASPSDIRLMEERFFDLLEAARTADKRVFMRRDFAFHEQIWKSVRNPYLTNALTRLVLPMIASCADRLVSGAPFDLLRDAQSHLPLLDAIKAGNPESARLAYSKAMGEWHSATRRVFDARTKEQANAEP